MSLRIRTRELRPAVVEMTLSGRLDAATAPDFETALLQVLDSEPEVLHLELGDLTYISSAGLGLII
ncbi:MAG: STAS domain-containing protein, partial [Thermoanaerobaculia bacterium]|nr:STAS domain-containing protein [Thermoanaerobaculia bacterium]